MQIYDRALTALMAQPREHLIILGEIGSGPIESVKKAKTFKRIYSKDTMIVYVNLTVFDTCRKASLLYTGLY